MFDSYGQFQANSIAPSHAGREDDPGARAIGQAASTFQALCWRARLRRVWGRVTRRPHGLLDLDEARRSKTIESIYEAGCLTIAVSRILGSECRVCDFDDRFLPLNSSTGQRWAGIYAARLCGQSLPAISVVQVGDTYYIRDGHHRVSVARLLGEEYIEAHVQVWQMKGEAVAAPAMRAQLIVTT
jgi:hypothetical protein